MKPIKPLVLLLCAGLFLVGPAGCKRKPATDAPAKTPLTKPGDGSVDKEALAKRIAEFEKSIPENMDEQLAQDEIDRKKLVSPPPPGFKPEAPGEHIRLSIALKKKMIRRGEKPWYQIRAQNVGSEDIYWTETFFKDGNWGTGSTGRWRYFLTTPSGARVRIFATPVDDVPGELVGYVPFPKNATEEEISAEVRRIAERSELDQLSIQLHPGETIKTAPWWSIPLEEIIERRKKGLSEYPEYSGEFREFNFLYELEEPGTYRFEVEYGLLPTQVMPTEEDARAAGVSFEELTEMWKSSMADRGPPSRSHAVEFEVVR